MTGVKEAVATIWTDVLRTADVTADDDFFAAGGDSVMAMVLTFSLGEKFGVELFPEVVFEAPTFGALCALIEERLASA